MNEPLLLGVASVEDIQLELLRRTSFNLFDGDNVHASPLKHRDLWLAALLDRQGIPSKEERDSLLTFGLIKLRDLPHNLWNADTLFILTPTREVAERLAQIGEEDGWDGDEVEVYQNESELSMSLGVSPAEFGLLSVWWD